MRKALPFTVLIVFLLMFTGCKNKADETTSANEETTTPTVTADGFKETTAAGITLSWKIVGNNLQVKVKAPTTGWVAVGFNPTQMMKDANIIIGYVSSGAVSIRDDFGAATTSHDADIVLGGRDDIMDKAGSENAGITEISFTIPLNSGDAFDRALAAGVTYPVILAYGNQDNFTTQHTTRTATQIQL